MQACQVGSLLIENKYWRKRVTLERGPRGEIFRVCRSDFELYFQMNQNSIYMNLLKVCQMYVLCHFVLLGFTNVTGVTKAEARGVHTLV